MSGRFDKEEAGMLVCCDDRGRAVGKGWCRLKVRAAGTQHQKFRREEKQ